MDESLLSQEQKELINDGQRLLDWVKRQSPNHFSDYSFLVSPFAKAYEGFLKVLFLKLKIIEEKQFFSDRFRVGKVLNPALQHKEWSAYTKLRKICGLKCAFLADQLWEAWKEGRNLIFHYFPHNLHRITLEEAERRIKAILAAIEISQSFIKEE